MLLTPLRRLLLIALVCVAFLAGPSASADEGREGRLVSAAWLQKHRAEVLLLDASFKHQHLAGHIAGSVNADLYSYGVHEPTRSEMEKRMQSWGVSLGKKIVVYDRGGDFMATRLFYDLYYYGVPAADLFILDGGMTGWLAKGGAVTQELTQAAVGDFRITALREEVRVRLPEFLAASGDPVGHVLIDGLESNYFYGVQKFFDRAGHVPKAISMPGADFYNADKTFKSPAEIRRQLRYFGVKPDQVVHSHCGGGVAASVPWFALKFLAEQTQTKLYLESQREWLRDDRGLPYWTYSAPQILRDSAGVSGWNSPMQRAFNASLLNLVDVRPSEKYALGHVPYALSIPSETLRPLLGQSQKLAALLGPAGVNPSHEVVIMGENRLTPDVALAFLVFEQLGHKKVSVLMDSVDEWGLRGGELTKAPTTVGAAKSPKDAAVPIAIYTSQPRDDVLTQRPDVTRGAFSKVYVAAGKALPSRKPPLGQNMVQLPYTDLLSADGSPKAAKDLWSVITKAGIPRHAEVVVFADDVADAATSYFVFKLMGWPDVKVWTD